MALKRERILVVEDEPDILSVVDHHLTKEGYRVSTAADGVTGLTMARRQCPDLVLLDLMLPGLDGTEVCRRLKEDPTTRSVAVIMFTAKADETDVVLGLGLGADDYVAKPFRPKELMARVKAVLRRGQVRAASDSGDRLVAGGLVIDSTRHEILLHGEALVFTPTEFRLLHFLASHPGRVFSRDQLLSRVITDAAQVGARNIDVHMRSVRGKLADHRECLETVRGVGYRFRHPQDDAS